MAYPSKFGCSQCFWAICTIFHRAVRHWKQVVCSGRISPATVNCKVPGTKSFAWTPRQLCLGSLSLINDYC